MKNFTVLLVVGGMADTQSMEFESDAGYSIDENGHLKFSTATVAAGRWIYVQAVAG